MPLSVEKLKELETFFDELVNDKEFPPLSDRPKDVLTAIRELIAIKEAEPVAWAVLNGVCIYSTYSKELIAKTIAAEQQRSHDLSGSLAAFSHFPLIRKPE